MTAEPSRSLVSRLQGELGPARVFDSLIDRIALSSDASFYLKIPQVVVRPSMIADIQVLFRIANETGVPLTFRAAGTSLSGQAITDGILVDLSRGWRAIEVQSNGNLVRVQPGAVGSWVNDSLRPYHRKIGPDPASINAAMMGGILANNSSGMCCGVVHNAYHTLHNITVVLPDGFVFSPGDPSSESRLKREEPNLFSGILKLRSRILADRVLTDRIRSKYRIKNTVGYSLNAFLDFERVSDVLAHVLIGSEGTLGFIADATLKTISAPAWKLTGLLFFQSARDAGAAVPQLLDAAAVELMDYASLQSIALKVGPLGDFILALNADAACLLIEYEFPSAEEREQARQSILDRLFSLPLIREPGLTDQAEDQALYWSIRKGLYPAVGSLRPAGTSALIEDVAVPVERLADLTVELQGLFRKHGYREAIIFGHAKDGNLHFVITPSFDSSTELKRYEHLMKDVVDIIVHRFDGSLKGEHGTGRNMAPFVAVEWGKAAYEIMSELKQLLDPNGICNPGVIINGDADAHLKDLKRLPVVDPHVDLCIECGYCESKCPSRDLTLSPRQRIVVRRRMKELEEQSGPSAPEAQRRSNKRNLKELEKSYRYSGIDTCAADGLCSLSCPVGIDTGRYIKTLREARHSSSARKMSLRIVKRFRHLERGIRLSLRLVRAFHAGRLINRTTRWLHRIFPGWSLPLLPITVVVPRRAHSTPGSESVSPVSGPDESTRAVDFLYFQTCLSRNLGSYASRKSSLAETLLLLTRRAGLSMRLTHGEGFCCGMPFQSKGYPEASEEAIHRTMEMLYRESNQGRLPIVVDASPCTYAFVQAVESPVSPREGVAPWHRDGGGANAGLRFLDSVQFADEFLLPRLSIHSRKNEIVMHPVCSLRKLNLVESLRRIGEACSSHVTIPVHAGCCGMAGDRGLFHPELIQAATTMELTELKALPGRSFDGYYSSSRMCEEGLSGAGGQNWISFLYLLEEASDPDRQPASEGPVDRNNGGQ